MMQADVSMLMASSASEIEWNANCDTVKSAFGGDYPELWYHTIILSGLLTLTREKHNW